MRILGWILVVYALVTRPAEGRNPIYLRNNGVAVIPQRRNAARQQQLQMQRQQEQQRRQAEQAAQQAQQQSRTNVASQSTNAAVIPYYYARPVPPAASLTNTAVTLAPPGPVKRATNAPPVRPPSERPQSIIEMRSEPKDPLLGFQQANAAKGFPESQYVMGLRYLQGIGVPKDEEQGRHWLEQAASQGHEKAKEKLRELKKGSPGDGQNSLASAPRT